MEVEVINSNEIIVSLCVALVFLSGATIWMIKRFGFSFEEKEDPVKEDRSGFTKLPDPPAWYKEQCITYYEESDEEELSQKEDIFVTKQVESLLDGRWTADKK